MFVSVLNMENRGIGSQELEAVVGSPAGVPRTN